MTAKARYQRWNADARIRLVDGFDVDGDVSTGHATLGAVRGYAMHGRQRVGGYDRSPPADDISVVVIVRRFDQDELKAPFFHRFPVDAPTHFIRPSWVWIGLRDYWRPCQVSRRVTPMNPRQRTARSVDLGRSQLHMPMIGHRRPCPDFHAPAFSARPRRDELSGRRVRALGARSASIISRLLGGELRPQLGVLGLERAQAIA